MNFLERLNKKKDKITFYYDLGRGRGQRPSTGIFIYVKPKTPAEKAHNKEAYALLDVKKSEAIIESQAMGSSYIPRHKFRENFFDYFLEYMKSNGKENSKHFKASLRNLRLFVGRDFLASVLITENFCKSFRTYLLERFNGETPSNYFSRFKWVVKSATADGYFRTNPVEDVAAKSNPSVQLKDNLEADEYTKLVNTPCTNQEVQLAFIFSCYTGLRWIDISAMKWKNIKGNLLTTRIIQHKTGRPVVLTLHPIAQGIIKKAEQYRQGESDDTVVFKLPTHDGANKIVKQWVRKAKIQKTITWSCARLSFSILLQDKNVDDATVACLLGHTTTAQVRRVYRRHRPKNEEATVALLPSPENFPHFLALD